ncbi:MAG: Beta-barrel assembly-enhancing protease [Fimbriimonadaceae bacterium]|nr:Beta-barrel assembly-enhancing protease [Fimbriimonadaceae bacterium]
MQPSLEQIAALFDLGVAQKDFSDSPLRQREGADSEESQELGRLCLNEGDYEGAIAHYRRAIDQGPDSDGAAHIGLAAALELSEDAEAALQAYREAARLDNSADAQIGMAEILRREGDSEAGLEHLYEAVELEPDNAFALHKLSEALMAKGKGEEAVQIGLAAVAKAPETAFYHLSAAELMFRRKMFGEALGSYRAALELSPGDDYIYLRTAIALWANGHRSEAMQSLKFACDLDPENSMYAELMAVFADRLLLSDVASEYRQRAGELDRYDEDALRRVLVELPADKPVL